MLTTSFADCLARGDHYRVRSIQLLLTPSRRGKRARRFRQFLLAAHHGAPGPLTVSPFYHFNGGIISPNLKNAIQSDYDRGSNYIGGVAPWHQSRPAQFSCRLQVFGERDNQLYGVWTPLIRATTLAPHDHPWANVEAFF